MHLSSLQAGEPRVSRWRQLLLIAVSAGSMASLSTSALAADTAHVEALLELDGVSDAQISPTGNFILYSRQSPDRSLDGYLPALHVVDAAGTDVALSTPGGRGRWSADGRRIAYLGVDDEGRPQIFIQDWKDSRVIAAEEPRQGRRVTAVAHLPKSIAWSPDGAWIAFRMFVPAAVSDPGEPEVLVQMRQPTWTERPQVIDRLIYKMDGEGLHQEGYDHLFIASTDGKELRQLTQGNWNVGARWWGLDEYGMGGIDWTPDSRSILFDGSLVMDRDHVSTDSQIFAVDIATLARRQITPSGGPWYQPKVSPDGKRLAYLRMGWIDQKYQPSELWVSQLDGSAAKRLVDDLYVFDTNFLWSRDSAGIYYSIDRQGSRNLHFVSLEGKQRRLTDGRHVLDVTSLNSRGLAAGTVSTATAPVEVVRVELARPDRWATATRVNEDFAASANLSAVEEIWHHAPDQTALQAWIVKPPKFDPRRKYPLIVAVHGGPHTAYRNESISRSSTSLPTGSSCSTEIPAAAPAMG
jgi:dipeptidyl aminopeptidase/acylaminoacyl peptidase